MNQLQLQFQNNCDVKQNKVTSESKNQANENMNARMWISALNGSGSSTFRPIYPLERAPISTEVWLQPRPLYIKLIYTAVRI
jgi:hypothetical protein